MDPYGNIQGFDEQPTKKKTRVAKKKVTKKKEKKQIDIFGNQQRDITAAEMADMESAKPPSEFEKIKKSYTSGLPLYMQTQTIDIPKAQMSSEYFSSISKNLAKDIIESLILNLSLAKDYDVSSIVDSVISKDMNESDFIKHVTKYIVILTHAKAAKFDTLIFAIQSQQLTGSILERAVEDNIVNFPDDTIEYEEKTFEIQVNLIGMRTMRRPTRPQKPIGIVYPDVEIVNYIIDMSAEVVTEQMSTDQTPFSDSSETLSEYSSSISTENSEAFLKIMKHITNLTEPSREINPELEKQRLEIVKKLKKQRKKGKNEEPEEEDESIPVDYGSENELLDELGRSIPVDYGSGNELSDDEDGFAPVCCACGEELTQDISLKTKKINKQGNIVTEEFCCIDPCFMDSSFKYKKIK